MSGFRAAARKSSVEFVIHSSFKHQVLALTSLRRDQAKELLTILKENREGAIKFPYPRGELHVKVGEKAEVILIAIVSKDAEVVSAPCTSEQKKNLILELSQAVSELA